MNRKKILSMAVALLMLINVFCGVTVRNVQAGDIKNQFDHTQFIGGTPAADTYSISSSADGKIIMKSSGGTGSINSTAVAGYFAYMDIAGDFKLSATAALSDLQNSEQSIVGVMAKKDAGAGDDKDPVVAAVFRPYRTTGGKDASLWATYRAEGGTPDSINGAKSSLEEGKAIAPETPVQLELQRVGDKFTAKYAVETNGTRIEGVREVELPIAAVKVGLFVSRATGTFSDVVITDGAGNPVFNSKGPVSTAAPAESTPAPDASGNPAASVCTAIQVAYTPAKTTYYVDDAFDALGLVVNGTFSSGEAKALEPSEYVLTGFDSSTAGEKTVTVTLKADAAKTAEFKVTVKASQLQNLEITRKPAKTQYYIGDKLDLAGMVISAQYSDTKQRLQPGEYAVDEKSFNTATPGQKTVSIAFKGKTAQVLLNVKAREAVRIEVTKLPKTTYYTGEAFDAAGIEVSRVYDNGDREVFAATGYTLDSAGFSSAAPGTCTIGIAPKEAGLAAIAFPVTIREKTAYTWKSIEFGQSTKPATNFVEPSNSGTFDGSIKLTALEGGGKVTGAHDGISFYYTEIDGAKDNFVLSADVKVIEFAKAAPDNQEAFGLMARDAIGKNGDSTVFSSNIAAVGGYRGKTQAFIRTGVTSSLGNEGTVQTSTSWDTARPAPENTYPEAAYRLTLAKTNTGYTASLNDAEKTSVVFYEPDALNVQDGKVYVGFYTARLATIEVSNVSFSVTAAATDAAKVLPPPVPVAPSVNVISLPSASKSEYALKLVPNVDGTVTVKKGETVIATDEAVTAKKVFTLPSVLAENNVTNFTVTFTPDTAQTLTSYNRIVTNFAITMKTYETADGAIYVSPTGTNAGTGTKEDPLDLDTAIKYVKEGQTIYMRGGTYNRTSPVTIPAGNDGNPTAMKTLAAYKGETVVLDFGTKATGLALAGNYWNVYGIDVTKASGVGFIVGGSYNKVELCKAYANRDTGIQISRIGAVSRELWPANNLILNCESFDNKDASDNNADGFAAKLTCGEGNVFRGCIAHNNVDDGWDLYTKAETGPIGVVLIEDCIAYNNGTLTDGYIGKGDKNGFKLGGEGISVPHTIKNSIAFGNGATGFTSNSNPAVQALDCISYDNAGANISFGSYAGIPLQFKIDRFISYRSKSGVADSYPASSASEGNYFCDGRRSANNSGVVLNSFNFRRLTPSIPYKRDASGTVIRGDFLKFEATPSIPVTSSPAAGAELKDISGHWAENNIGTMVAKGVVQGYTDGTFLPDKTITRAEFSALLVKAFKLEPKNGKVFVDTAAHWADGYIATVVYYGIAKGYNDSSFGPDDFITREQMAVMLVNAAKGKAASVEASFADRAAVSDWAGTAVDTAAKNGFIAGYKDNTFRPKDLATRAEAVTVLVNALK